MQCLISVSIRRGGGTQSILVWFASLLITFWKMSVSNCAPQINILYQQEGGNSKTNDTWLFLRSSVTVEIPLKTWRLLPYSPKTGREKHFSRFQSLQNQSEKLLTQHTVVRSHGQVSETHVAPVCGYSQVQARIMTAGNKPVGSHRPHHLQTGSYSCMCM